MRLHAAIPLALLAGCGLLRGAHDPPLPEYIKEPNTAYQLDGEVRDELTLAPIPDAEVTLTTDRPGYVVLRKADAGGRFSIGYSTVLYRKSNGELVAEKLLLFGDPANVEQVARISIRAEGHGRCSPRQTFRPASAPAKVLLLVGDCGRYRPARDGAGASAAAAGGP